MWKVVIRVVGLVTWIAHSMVLIGLYPEWKEIAGMYTAMFQITYMWFIMTVGFYTIFWEWGKGD
jgi:hypothetical protein